MNELETSYINKISLKNYKSIRDLTIDFHHYMDTKSLELKDFWVHSNLEELDDVLSQGRT
jgi:succinate dehydrogenase/fumarate reductase-like Fe-S protein